jgi:alkylation response protein AidB-like acyl-CoA dehydrogenase
MAQQVLTESAAAAALRDEVRTWLEENWDKDMPLREWRQKLLESGWGVPTFPREWYGRGLSGDLARVAAQEFARVRASALAGGMARGLASPTIVEHGDDEQRRRLIPPALLGDETWCQLFSEPGAGSDLAGVTTTAVLHGDEFIINGQKVWTSGATKDTDMGMLVCRTDWDVPKHQGISWIAFPMKQPGVEIRPLKQMTGGAGFNEVFITDARAPRENVIGGINGGWKVTTTTLAHERAGGVQVGVDQFARRRGDQHDEASERARYMAMQRAPGVIELAKEFGRNTDPVYRQEVVKHYILSEIARFNTERARAARKAGNPGPQGSTMKVERNNIGRLQRKLAPSILGAAGMLTGSDAPYGGAIPMQVLSSCGPMIFAGTDEIQHNIIGERILGLPKEPSVDTDVPFREVKTSGRRPTR